MADSHPRFVVRPYDDADEQSWVRCRALSFLYTQYYDDVKPRRPTLAEPAIALVATRPGPQGEVIGILDVVIDGSTATIDTVATHPDHQGAGIATSLLRAAIRSLADRGIVTLDAWTREDVPANNWYRRNGFTENFSYLHAYLGDGDDPAGFSTPEGLSLPVTAFVHGAIEHETQLRARYQRTYTCRQYIRPIHINQHPT
ncbi:MAG: GNAT family N-acetyltransferase [Actinobacteria bacterium 69-20]|mgnify:FL=1|nr:GNAT family N-acetyltransferase [Actinomycetota bacterium]OJV25041.1 MAG: GNAT family N-acetyltransferase [Actinobacteria bacterium 69-20]